MFVTDAAITGVDMGATIEVVAMAADIMVEDIEAVETVVQALSSPGLSLGALLAGAAAMAIHARTTSVTSNITGPITRRVATIVATTMEVIRDAITAIPMVATMIVTAIAAMATQPATLSASSVPGTGVQQK